MAEPPEDAVTIRGLRAQLAEATARADFNAALLDGRDLEKHKGAGNPRCRTCGRDGHQGSAAREAALRLVRRAEEKAATVAAELGRLRGRIGRAVAASEHGGCKDAIQDMLSILLDDGPEPGS